MLLGDILTTTLTFSENQANVIQRTFGFYYCDYEQGVHMLFKSRYMAERFAREYLLLSPPQFSTAKVTSESGDDLGYEILIAVVPIVSFSKEGD